MKNKTATFENLDDLLGASPSGEVLLWFLQKFRAGNNLQRLILIVFTTLSGLAMFAWSMAVFCTAMFFLERSVAHWADGVAMYGEQACLMSTFAFMWFYAYSAIGTLKEK